MKVFVVYHTEPYVGSFMQGVFSSEDKAQSWIDSQSKYPFDECCIEMREIDDLLQPSLTETQSDEQKG